MAGLPVLPTWQNRATSLEVNAPFLCLRRLWRGRMELVHHFLDMLLHLDKHLQQIIEQYGVWTYLILFLIVFCETGLVVTPILPGDSLLFAAGTFAAAGSGATLPAPSLSRSEPGAP